MTIITTHKAMGETLLSFSDITAPPKWQEFINKKDVIDTNTRLCQITGDLKPYYGSIEETTGERIGPDEKYASTTRDYESSTFPFPDIYGPVFHHLVKWALENNGKEWSDIVITNAFANTPCKDISCDLANHIKRFATKTVAFYQSKNVEYTMLNGYCDAKVSPESVWLTSLSGGPEITPAEKLSLLIMMKLCRRRNIGVYNPRLEGYYLVDAAHLYDTI